MTADHERSRHEEMRNLRDARKGGASARKPLGSCIRARFAEIGLDEDVPQLRGEEARPATFEK